MFYKWREQNWEEKKNKNQTHTTVNNYSRCSSTWRRATTHPRWGDNITEEAVSYAKNQSRRGGGHFLASATSRSDPTRLFTVGFWKEEVYFSPIRKPWITWRIEYERLQKDTNQRFIKVSGRKSRIGCCAQVNKWNTYWTLTGNEKNFFELLFTMVCYDYFLTNEFMWSLTPCAICICAHVTPCSMSRSTSVRNKVNSWQI